MGQQRSPFDTGSVQYRASLSRISKCILLCWQKVNNDKTHELILENASTNCVEASVNNYAQLDSQGELKVGVVRLACLVSDLL